MKKIMTLAAGLCCVVIAIVSGCHGVSVQAAERKVPPYILNVQRECMLNIYTDAAQKTAGQKLSLYQVGKADATSLSLSFVLCDPYEGVEADLLATENEKRRQTIQALCEYVSAMKLQPDQTVELDKNGTAKVKIPQGVYLICQTEESDTKIQATLVSVPYVSENLDEWIYDMNVELKAVNQPVPTGDPQDFTGYAALAIAAVLLLMLLGFARKRTKKN